MKRINTYSALVMISLLFACQGTNQNKTSEESSPKPKSMLSVEHNGLKLIKKSDCKTCHNKSSKSIGPSYVDIALKYDNDEATYGYLTGKIIEGGTGVWGSTAMTPHADLKDSDIKEMLDYIFTLK